MAWRRTGDKPLSEPMMVSLLTHICVTRPQWVNALRHLVKTLLQHHWISYHIHNCLLKYDITIPGDGLINILITIKQDLDIFFRDNWHWHKDKTNDALDHVINYLARISFVKRIIACHILHHILVVEIALVLYIVSSIIVIVTSSTGYILIIVITIIKIIISFPSLLQDHYCFCIIVINVINNIIIIIINMLIITTNVSPFEVETRKQFAQATLHISTGRDTGTGFSIQ